MSRRRAGRFTSATTLAARAQHHPAPTPVVDDERSVQGEAARQSAAAKSAWATRPLRRTPAGPSRIAAQAFFNDPSNYLG